MHCKLCDKRWVVPKVNMQWVNCFFYGFYIDKTCLPLFKSSIAELQKNYEKSNLEKSDAEKKKAASATKLRRLKSSLNNLDARLHVQIA